jgi:hypothetical protein
MSHFVAESIGYLRGQPVEGIPLFEAQMSVDDHAALPALGQRGAALRELQVPHWLSKQMNDMGFISVM